MFLNSQYDKHGNITRRLRFSCSITKATNVHLEYVILITLPWQQWLGGRASILRHSVLPVLLLQRNI